MILKYDGMGKVEEAPVFQIHGSPFGLVKVYKIAGEYYFEAPECFGVLKQQLLTQHMPAILKLLGLPVTPVKKER